MNQEIELATLAATASVEQLTELFDTERMSAEALNDLLNALQKQRPAVFNSMMCDYFEVACYRVGDSCFAEEAPACEHDKWFVSVPSDSVLAQGPALELADTFALAEASAVAAFELKDRFLRRFSAD